MSLGHGCEHFYCHGHEPLKDPNMYALSICFLFHILPFNPLKRLCMPQKDYMTVNPIFFSNFMVETMINFSHWDYDTPRSKKMIILIFLVNESN